MSLVIFLDIDGPMIPARSFIFDINPSFNQILDAMCVKVLRAIIDRTNAQIVFNTTHNRTLFQSEYGPGLLARFADAGFSHDIHDDNHTIYPDVDRTTAIREWLSRHPDVKNWVAFDDVEISDDRAFLTDPDHGIGWGEYQHAKLHLLGEKPRALLI